MLLRGSQRTTLMHTSLLPQRSAACSGCAYGFAHVNPHRKAFLQAFLAKHFRKPALQSRLTKHSRKAALQSVSRIRLTKLSPQIRFTKHSLKPALQSCLAKSYHKFVSQSHPQNLHCKFVSQSCFAKPISQSRLKRLPCKPASQTHLAKRRPGTASDPGTALYAMISI